MRADNDHAVENSVQSCKDDSKPHQCPEEKWEDAELKIPENGKNNKNVCELFYDTRSGDEWDKENGGNTLERRSSGESNEAGNKIRDNGQDVAANKDSLEKDDPVFYMDKNVTACDLPEIVVCYKENTYHVVKDICVDEGVPVHEKFLFGEKDSVKCSSNSNQCESEDLTKADKVTSDSLEVKSSEDRNSKLDDDSELCNDPKTNRDVEENDPKTNRDVEESSREGFADAEGSSNCNQEHLIVTGEGKEAHTHMLNLSEISHEIESDVNSKDEVKDTALETELENTEDPKKAEEKLSSVSTATSQEPNKACKDPERPETENQQPNLLVADSSCDEDKLFSSGFGETSFSAADAVSISGHITYSGPIAFSGSLSVRSDASTTSGRSFAFPILQSEWNSSPVRMANANKRRQKGWRHVLLCCRFS
ncbi:unnamed protein product [Thlaspi arvense]|uniref:Uncharacterized protein n=1 Tax=Thlaspi arvense TaxID=13288 RepID=A0AAU9RLZ4_THLAR|nr:unnamed protein product [Thlaspi arvense]